MSVLQPLYFAGGRYTASIDRKMLTALIDPEATGKRIAGVIPPSGSMAVSGTTTSTIAVAPGFCVIPDSSSPSAASPGLYLCAIDSSSETLPTLAATTAPASRTDLIYASVSETSFTVTNKELSSNTATLYTSTAHGFSPGYTVVISGVDEIFDGSYEIRTVPTTTTFTYERTYGSSVASDFVTPIARLASSSATTDVVITASAIPATNQITFTTSTQAYAAGNRVTVIGVSTELDGTYEVLASPAPTSTAFSVAKVTKIAPSVGTVTLTTKNPTTTSKPISSVAKARVPFAIKVSAGTVGGAAGTLPSGSNLELARVTVTGTAVTRQDLRQFTAATGGIRLYNSSLTGTTYDPDGSVGGARYDTSTNKFEVYSTEGTDKWQPIFYGTTKHHDSRATDASALSLHHTLGNTAGQAAKGNHTHTVDATGSTGRLGLHASLNTAVGIYNGATRRVLSQSSASPTLLAQSGSLDIPANTVVLVIATASVTVTATGTKCNFGIKLGDGTITRTAAQGETDGIHNVTSIRRYFFDSAKENVVFQFAAYKDSSATGSDIYDVFDADMIVVPFSSITTNILT